MREFERYLPIPGPLREENKPEKLSHVRDISLGNFLKKASRMKES